MVERIRRTRPDEPIKAAGTVRPPPLEKPQPEDAPWQTRTVRRVFGSMNYRWERKDTLGRKEVRYYRIGKVGIAFVQVNEDDMPPGKYALYIHGQGNKGMPFKTEDDLHAFLITELEASL